MSEIDAAIAAGPDDQYAPSFFAETGKPADSSEENSLSVAM
jgi:hypothetical protein